MAAICFGLTQIFIPFGCVSFLRVLWKFLMLIRKMDHKSILAMEMGTIPIYFNLSLLLDYFLTSSRVLPYLSFSNLTRIVLLQ